MNRTSHRLAFSLLGSSLVPALVLGTLVAGCGSSGGKSYPEASVDFDAHPDTVSDAGVDAVDAAATPPTPGVGSKLIVNGNIELIGSGSDTCTNQLPPSTDRWCGFTRLATDLMNNELWVVNVTKVAAGVTVQCVPSAADPNCIRLSMGLYSDPNNQFRVHGFDGDTLTYEEVPSASTQGFLGHIFAWRPGWKTPHALTGDLGFFCNGNAVTNTAICVENPVTDSTGTFVHTAELHAGVLDDVGTPLPLIDTIIISASSAEATAGVSKWAARLSPDGRSVAWSTRATDTGTEDLKWQRFGTTTPVPVAPDVDQWTISSDSKKWYWLKSFNYSTTGAPSGTLQAAPYPDGTAPVTIATNVGDYTPAGSSLYYRTKVTGDTGTLLLTPDLNTPAAVTMIDTGVEFVFGASDDGKNAAYTKNIQTDTNNNFFFDAYVAGAAATMPCTLTNQPTAFIPPTFLVGGTMLGWGRVSGNTVQGVSTTVPGCTTRTFATDFVTLTPIGDEGIIYLDTLDPDPNTFEASLRYSVASNGVLPSPGMTIQARAGLEYAALLPALDAVLYTITSNTSADGLYLNTALPFKTVQTVDAGANLDLGNPSTDGGAPLSDAGVTDTAGASDAAGAADAQSGG